MDSIEFNLNQWISVQLTDQGRAEHKRQHEEYRKTYPKWPEYVAPEEDEEGWSKWQGWDLFNHFGHMLNIGSERPFSLTIRFHPDA